MSRNRSALALLALIAALGVLGTLDYADEQRQHQHQCAMIAAGHWPADVNPNCQP